MKSINLYIIAVFSMLYFIFLFWYYKLATPFSPDEIESYITLLQHQTDGTGRISKEELMQMANFMKNDDGKAFYNINIVKLRKQALYSGQPDPELTGKEANDSYSRFMMKEVLMRACHPIVMSKPFIQLMGKDTGKGQPYWDEISIIRYRSRRDFMNVITSEGFKEGNVHKWAGVEDTLVYPAQGVSLGIPPLLVALITLTIASITYILSFLINKVVSK